MPSKRLVQIVSYVDPEVKVKLERELARSKTRTSMSSYIESVLKEHFRQQKKEAAA